MSRRLRPAVAAAVVGIALVSCATAKSTGLPPGPTPEPVPMTQVEVVDNLFEPPELTVEQGITVTWEFTGGAPHNVRFTTLDYDSHPDCANSNLPACSSPGDAAERVFEDDPGEYPYYCVIHGTPQGGGMAGTIIVTPAA